ncbi:sorbitol-6-phosphate 2-dehydrogenase [Geomicrobium halophilum]|uniref:Sorbitol-6-phosphate 2-dehydrogenase n=1 Tax=Geomicrobium halophilum TaxID=549000 RepID=A0A841PVD2_9BACL|nr:sorbitol-6-phosphate dehydrogenase [Geomicrobium halophilum]MBB6451116.1 sorbitol-6-phosphate 2-dehydrogenase [Geomicrobium halophilum]
MTAQTAIVAGGAQNLGEHLSLRLSEEGYNVVVADLQGCKAETVAQKISNSTGNKTLGLETNMTDEDEVKALMVRTKEEFGTVDLLVYNAGVARSTKIDNFNLSDWQMTLDVNLTGYFLCAREASKVMIGQGSGNIVQINSKSGKVGSKHNSGYSASKFGGIGLTQSLALDLAEHNIRVNSILPGNLLESPMFQSLIPSYANKLGIDEDEVEQVYKDKVPMKRGCTYDDVSNAVIFYASEKASYMTGQSINVTGGQVMH